MENEQQIIYFNELGIKYLENNPAHSIFYLNQALLKTRCLSSSQNKSKLLAMTYNNLGCYYNNSNNSAKAFEFFQKSAKLGHIKGSDHKSTAYAHLNIAGILSKETQHEKALRHALKSVRYLKLCPESQLKQSATLVSAYQMIGMEYLALGQSIDARSSWETALELCTKYLGKNHEKFSEIEELMQKNFRLKSSLGKSRAGSVQTNRNLTPIHVNNRTLKSRLVSFIKEKSFDATASKPRPKKWARFIVKSGDISYIRKIEFSAACKIQAWWRGVLGRRDVKEEFLKNDLKTAEKKAREAFQEVERLKGLLAKNSTRTSQVSSAENIYGELVVSRKLSVVVHVIGQVGHPVIHQLGELQSAAAVKFFVQQPLCVEFQNFSDLSNVLPSYLQSAQTKPSEVLKFIIEEFKDSPSAFSDLSLSKNFLKMKASNLIRAPLNEFFQINSKSSVFLEVVWDVSPSASLVVDMIEKLEKSWPLELQGLIAARGFYHTAFIKSKTNWKSFEDGRIVNWLGLVAGLVSSFAQPVFLFLKQNSGQSPKSQDLARLREFAKLQDSRLQNSFVESWNEFELKDYENTRPATRQELTRGTSRDFYNQRDWNGESSETFKADRATSDNLRYRHRSSQPEKSHDSEKLTTANFEKDWRTKETASSKPTEDTSNLYKTGFSFNSRTENLEGSKGSNFFNPNFTEKFEGFDRLEKFEGSGRIEKTPKSEKEYERSSFHSKSMPLGFKVVETHKGQMAEIRMVGLQGPCKVFGTSQSLKKESFSAFSSSQPQSRLNHGDKTTENWKLETNLQKSYLSEGKTEDRLNDSRFFDGKTSENRLVQSHTPQGRPFQDFHVPETQYKDGYLISSYSGGGLKHSLNNWVCPKCSENNLESVYECSSCRFINWDRFYSIKAKTMPGRSGSIPAKTEDRYSKTFKSSVFERKESFDYPSRLGYDSDFGSSQVFWDEDRKRNTCSSYFSQVN